MTSLTANSPQRFNRLEPATELIFQSVGKQIRLATPLGLGKPNQLLNQIYGRAKEDPSCHLKIFTALSLGLPHFHSELEKRFLGPFLKKHFGENYPELEYVEDQLKGRLPKNIEIHEFYMQAAQNLHRPQAQQKYTSLNYTHVAQSLLQENLNVIVQLISKNPSGDTYSLSCNPDLTLDLLDLYRQNNKKILVIGVVHPDLPFLGGDAEVNADYFDVLVESPEVSHTLFALPRVPLSPTDHMIGLYASQLIQDDGTLQIGIGSLSRRDHCGGLFAAVKKFFLSFCLGKALAGKKKIQLCLYILKFSKKVFTEPVRWSWMLLCICGKMVF